MSERKFYRIDLPMKKADLLIKYLRESQLYFETSENYDLIHFEILLTQDEFEVTNDWIENNLT